MRLTLPLAATVLAAAITAVCPLPADAQVRTRAATRNVVLSRYVPAHFKPEVRSGRIMGTTVRRSSTQINSSGENLSIRTDIATGRAELKYEGPLREGIRIDGKTRKARMSILLDTAGRMEIEITLAAPLKAGAAVQSNRKNKPAPDLAKSNHNKSDHTVAIGFNQHPGRRISFTIAGGPKPRVMQAGTIWELLIGNREECRAHLLPILYKLRPGWNLLTTADQIEAQLLHIANENAQPQYDRWQKLVEQLGHDNYSSREAADKQLRLAGRRALALLKKLDKSKLDAEQKFRIARIVRSYDLAEQNPREIAEEMRDNPSIWLAVAADTREPVRKTACAELKRLLKRPMDFNPAAPPAVRKNQLEKIERSINSSK